MLYYLEFFYMLCFKIKNRISLELEAHISVSNILDSSDKKGTIGNEKKHSLKWTE